MNPALWPRLKELLADAMELPAADRAAFVTASCGDDTTLRCELESLLAESGDDWEACAAELHHTRTGAEAESRTDEQLGSYRIVRQIGRGGMGAVYLAERADEHFEKQVAIKLLKRGTDTDEVLRRFRAERRILARLGHPNIAQLIDAGTTSDGLPYFVLEYVAGERVTDYCVRRGLSIPARLQLFLKICGAVQFAHQNLVIHRDLKAGNILVTPEGEPKLLDFGIAKIIDPEADYQLTALDLQRLTPAYASPEQVRGEPITTVTDVYSLGALLYELLTGGSAHRFTTERPTASELQRVIVEQARSKPSSAAPDPATARQLQGDLDNIVLKALRKEPAQRYAGVSALADDVSRHLDGRPVHARPATVGYRTAKFVRRNPLAFAGAFLLLLTLLGGTAATAWQWTVARSERAKAETRFEILRKSSRTLITEIHGALMNLSGSLEARKLLLQRAVEQLDALAAEAGDDRRLQHDLAEAYQNIAYLPDKPLAERIALFEKAVALNRKVIAQEPENIAAREGLAEGEINLADFARARGDTDEALRHNRVAIDLLEAIAAQEPADLGHREMLWNASYNSAITLRQLGRAAEALEIAGRIRPIAFELREKQSASSDNQARRIYLTRAIAASSLVYLGRYEEAIAELHATLEETAAARQRFPLGQIQRLDESVFNSSLAMALERDGQREEALATMPNAVALAEALTHDEPNDLSYQMNAGLQNSQLAHLLLRSGKTAESIEIFHRASIRYDKLLLADPDRKQAQAELAYARGGLARALAKNGELAGAMAEMRPAVSFYSKVDPTQTSGVTLLHDCAETLAAGGEIYLLDGGNIPEARELFARSLGIWTALRDRAALSKADAAKPDEVAHALALCDTRIGGR